MSIFDVLSMLILGWVWGSRQFNEFGVEYSRDGGRPWSIHVLREQKGSKECSGKSPSNAAYGFQTEPEDNLKIL